MARVTGATPPPLGPARSPAMNCVYADDPPVGVTFGDNYTSSGTSSMSTRFMEHFRPLSTAAPRVVCYNATPSTEWTSTNEPTEVESEGDGEVTTESAEASLERELQMRHEDIVNESVWVGLMFASKAIMQLLANPFVGPLTNK